MPQFLCFTFRLLPLHSSLAELGDVLSIKVTHFTRNLIAQAQYIIVLIILEYFRCGANLKIRLVWSFNKIYPKVNGHKYIEHYVPNMCHVFFLLSLQGSE